MEGELFWIPAQQRDLLELRRKGQHRTRNGVIPLVKGHSVFRQRDIAQVREAKPQQRLFPPGDEALQLFLARILNHADPPSTPSRRRSDENRPILPVYNHKSCLDMGTEEGNVYFGLKTCFEAHMFLFARTLAANTALFGAFSGCRESTPHFISFRMLLGLNRMISQV